MPIPKLIRPNELAKRLGVSLPTFYRMARRPDFPRKVHLNRRAVGYREDDVLDWLDKNTADRNAESSYKNEQEISA